MDKISIMLQKYDPWASSYPACTGVIYRGYEPLRDKTNNLGFRPGPT